MIAGRLIGMIDAFEDAYRPTGAIGGIDIGGNVELRFVADRWDHDSDEQIIGGLMVSIDKGTPIEIADAPVGLVARVAQELPRLAEILDAGAQQIEQEIVKGEDVLGEWLKSRGLLV